ncbi:hypothetical protein CPB86DRAFT_699861 [Serendipita vermifera]|nr:hypothetical protein CPB86DRAFT_699861 [Serendipita vermifera]
MSKRTYDNCLFAAQLVLAALREIGEVWCCLVGGMAIRLNGKRGREVKDLDIIILNASADSRSIQIALVQRYHDLFFLVPPKDRAATFMKLYFRIPKTPHTIKVDLLLSSIPILEIPPSLHASHFARLHSFNVAPIYFVLYHKLFGWNLRHHAPEKWNNEKAKDVDYPDIIYLCDRIYQLRIQPLSKTHLGKQYLEKFAERAKVFCDLYGGFERRMFKRIGFSV